MMEIKIPLDLKLVLDIYDDRYYHSKTKKEIYVFSMCSNVSICKFSEEYLISNLYHDYISNSTWTYEYIELVESVLFQSTFKPELLKVKDNINIKRKFIEEYCSE